MSEFSDSFRAPIFDPLKTRIRSLEKESLALADEIKELKKQVTEAKTDSNHWFKKHDILLRQKTESEEDIRSHYRERIDSLKIQKHKKSCPINQGRLCTKEKCMMWIEGNQHVRSYCTIAKGLGFLQNIGMGE